MTRFERYGFRMAVLVPCIRCPCWTTVGLLDVFSKALLLREYDNCAALSKAELSMCEVPNIPYLLVLRTRCYIALRFRDCHQHPSASHPVHLVLSALIAR